MINNILTILTETDREEIKRALKEIIIEQIRSDFADTGSYIFDPSEVDNMMTDAIDEVKEEIKPILKEYMMEEMKKKMGISFD